MKLEYIAKREATFNNVYKALKRGQYQIIHFNGHARFDDQNHYRSGLVLYDSDMITGQLASTIGQKPPILCFINACETAKKERERQRRAERESP